MTLVAAAVAAALGSVQCGGLAAGVGTDAGGSDAGPDVVAIDRSLPPAEGSVDAGRDASIDASPHDAAKDVGSCDSEAGLLARWAAMDESVVSPYHLANLDLGSREAGITLDQAEAVNCQGEPADAAAFPQLGSLLRPEAGPSRCDACGHCYDAITWGTSREVTFFYNAATEVVSGMVLDEGYTGSVTFHGAAGSAQVGSTYVIRLGDRILKDGAPFTIDWTDPKLESLMEIYNGLMATFSTGYKYLGSYLCSQDAKCLIYPLAYEGYYWFGVIPLQLYFRFAVSGSAPTQVPTQVYAIGAGFSQRQDVWRDGGPVIDDAGNYVFACDGGK